jgi:hypothetical protein
MLAAALSIRVSEPSDQPIGRFEARMMDWMADMSRPISAPASHSLPPTSPCEMLAIVIMLVHL